MFTARNNFITCIQISSSAKNATHHQHVHVTMKAARVTDQSPSRLWSDKCLFKRYSTRTHTSTFADTHSSHSRTSLVTVGAQCCVTMIVIIIQGRVVFKYIEIHALYKIPCISLSSLVWVTWVSDEVHRNQQQRAPTRRLNRENAFSKSLQTISFFFWPRQWHAGAL